LPYISEKTQILREPTRKKAQKTQTLLPAIPKDNWVAVDNPPKSNNQEELPNNDNNQTQPNDNIIESNTEYEGNEEEESTPEPNESGYP
jgi:hypothetical protein